MVKDGVVEVEDQVNSELEVDIKKTPLCTSKAFILNALVEFSRCLRGFGAGGEWNTLLHLPPQ